MHINGSQEFFSFSLVVIKVKSHTDYICSGCGGSSGLPVLKRKPAVGLKVQTRYERSVYAGRVEGGAAAVLCLVWRWRRRHESVYTQAHFHTGMEVWSR